MKNAKNIVIGFLLIAVMGMSVGYAALAQRLDINGTANVDASWDIKFSKITEISKTGATIVTQPVVNGTSATFDVSLNNPGASVIYEIEISNNGSIDAVLDTLTDLTTINETQPTDIVYTITGVTKNEALNAGQKTTARIKVEWLSSSTQVPEVKQKTATIYLNYVQKTT